VTKAFYEAKNVIEVCND